MNPGPPTDSSIDFESLAHAILLSSKQEARHSTRAGPPERRDFANLGAWAEPATAPSYRLRTDTYPHTRSVPAWLEPLQERTRDEEHLPGSELDAQPR